MIIYGSSLSPFVRKVIVFAAEKGIALEVRPTGDGPGVKSPEFLAASPAGKMPALVDGDYALADSSAIVQYLEALHPEPKLIPTEPRARGRAIWFDEWADTLFGASCGKLFFNRVVAPRFLGHDGDDSLAETAERQELPSLLDYLERCVAGGQFLVEERLTLADIAVAAQLVNLAHMRVDLSRWPQVLSYLDGIVERPSFATLVEKERPMFAPQPA